MEIIIYISNIFLWILLTCNLLILFALAKKINSLAKSQSLLQESSSTADSSNTFKLGETIPNLVIEALDGSLTRLTDYQNWNLAIVFVSPGCFLCEKQMLELNQVYAIAEDVGVRLLVMSLGNTEDTRKFVRATVFTRPVFVAPRDRVSFAEDFKIPGTPFFYITNQKHEIIAKGFMDHVWDNNVRAWRLAKTSIR